VNPKKSTKADAMKMKLMKLTAVMCVASLMSIAAMAQGAATANLSGAIKDPKNAMVANATVTATNADKGIERSASTNAEGLYQIANIPPGTYTISATAPGFGKAITKNVVVTVGQAATLNLQLAVAAATETVNVSGQVENVETQRTSTASTVEQLHIDYQPTNTNDYVDFSKNNSMVTRDNAQFIGAAPGSKISVSGQRQRSNAVSVDGVDGVDNSTNSIRSTVPLEAVQEFQVLTGNYNAEYGRATGGVINVVSRSGSNKFHGDVFGFYRDNAFDATNPFSTISDPAFTRTRYGLTLGGPIKKDKTYYFVAWEGTRRNETGFTSIGQNNFGLVPFDFTPCGVATTLQVSPVQRDFINANLGPLGCNYAAVAGIASNTALNGNAGPLGGNAPNFVITSAAPIPGSFINMGSLPGNYPISEKTDIVSLRLDHKINDAHSLSLRLSGTPSYVSGIQVNGQNQVLGQNSFSRTSTQDLTDLDATIAHLWAISPTRVNEFRFQYAHRRLGYDPSNMGDTTGDTDTLPDGQGVAINMPGVAFFGREPFSFVHRTEDRYQFVDNYTWNHGKHTMKMGVDINHLPISANFTLNFGGLYNFGSISSTALGFPSIAPAFNPIQAYGLGLPQVFVQGVGNPHDSFSNNTLGLYWQDTWRATQRLTVNLGLRYDAEYTPEFKAVNALSQTAQDKLGITQGIPRDLDNIAPRVGLAWDPWGDGKTVVRAGYGIFYDHPLLGLAFDSDIADGSQAPQLAFFGGSPGGCTVTGANLNAANLFQGIFDGSCIGSGTGNFGFLPNQQRFDAGLANSVFVNQNYLSQGVPLSVQPFGFPVSKNFQYAYSHQFNIAFEHEFAHNFIVSFGYNANLGRHLNRPINANPVSTEALITNWERSLTDPTSGTTLTTNPLAVGSVSGFAPCGVNPGGQPWINASLVSFFRLTGGINPSSFGPLAAACAPIASLMGISNENVPFSDMIANYSNGTSSYHGLTTTIRKAMGNHYEFSLSHTWSHAIDDSTDLQSLLAPQDSRFVKDEVSNSIFDQRHRLILTGVYQSGEVGASGSAKHAVLSGWTVAPVLEWSSGRPFNILTGSDNNFDLSSNTDRPLIVPGPGTSNCGDAAVQSIYSPTGWIQPACFIDSNPTDGVASAPLRGNLGRNVGRKPFTIFNDIRVAKHFKVTERFGLDGMVDVFNVFNRLNVSDVNVLWTDAGKPTASFDPRQIQFGLKLSW
jgi:Carboxypeptidase regulatory-like domain/TonB dependent receptor/TonB-dependent Receptor Plug Domain